FQSALPLLVFSLMLPRPPTSTLFPYTTLFRSHPDFRSRCRVPGNTVGDRLVAVVIDRDDLRTCRVGRAQDDLRLQAFLSAENGRDRKSTRLNSSHVAISYAVFCLKKKNLNDDL